MTFEKVKEILIEQLYIDECEITMNTHLTDDLSADEIDFVNIIYEIENTFDIVVDDESCAKWVYVKDIVDYLENQLSNETTES